MLKSIVPVVALMAALAMPAAAEPALTDAQIAQIAYTAGEIDIAAADQALKQSKSPEVVAFAEQMARDHAAVNEQALALLARLGVKPEASDTSTALEAAAKAKSDELAALDGAACDAAYIANEVAYHRLVNQTLSGTLIPAAQNAEFKALLETGLTLFTEHQLHAERLAATLE